MKRRLLLSPSHRPLLEATAADAAPEECCGVLLGRRLKPGTRVVTRVVATGNARSRDRDRGYEIDPREVLAAWTQARAAGEMVVGFYHSHPAGPARPSASDVLAAWSGMSYVILAPRQEGGVPATGDSAGWELTSWHRGPGGDLDREALRGGSSGEVAA